MEEVTPKLTTNLQAVIYARVSSEEQREGQTIESQVNELRKFAHERGYAVVKEYLDEGWSGGLLDRPALDALRDDASRGLFQAVLLNDVDRLAREVAHLGVVKRDLATKGVQLLFRKLPNGQGPTDNLLINMLGAFAEFERELIADRTRRGKRYKAEVRKLIVGNIPPYGYTYVKKDRDTNTEGYYQVLPEEAAVVKKIFELVDGHHLTARGVVRWLTGQKIPPRQGEEKWAKSTVLRILHRTEYIGLAYYNKQESKEPPQNQRVQKYRRRSKTASRLRPQTEWIPIPVPDCRIIPEEQFQRVQDLLRLNKILSARNTRRQYLLAKLLHCQCGALMYGEPVHSRPFYRCSNKRLRFPLPKTCQAGMISTRLVDTATWEAVKGLLLNPKLIAAHIEQYNAYRTQESRRDTAAIEPLQGALKQIDLEENRVFEAYKVGVISLSKYQQEVQKLREKRTSHQNQLHQVLKDQKTAIAFSGLGHHLHRFCALLRRGMKNIESSFEERQRFMRLVVQKAVLHRPELILDCNIPIIEGIPRGGGIVATPIYHCGHNITIPVRLTVKV